MPANIRDAMDRIVTLEESLSISAPVAQSIKNAFKFFPSRNSALPDRPCFINTWRLVGQSRRAGGWDLANYEIHTQLYVEDADLEQACDIATAFHEAFLVAFDADITLNDGTALQNIRGEDPTLALLEWGGKGYAGLDMYIDLQLFRLRTFAP